MAAPASGGQNKREAIIRAATTLFGRYGYRRTTVELIAREARLAKPTLYAHFEDKDAIFVAVCQAVMDRIVAQARAASAERDAVARLTGVLAAKFTTVFELVESSPHARELLESSDARARDVVAAGDRAFAEVLLAAIKSAAREQAVSLARFGGKAATLQSLLMAAGHGASWGAGSAAEHRAQLGALVRAIIERPAAPRAGRSR
ncbi:MAG: TetR/AcrR family transcriptional regulator [Nannocystaceae bacterium]|nr:TetR/AcrR family transcriptional regulator [Nannocystaceae bacterium]